MTLNDAYLDYKQDPNPDTLTALFTACQSYASTVVTGFHLSDAEDVTSEAVASAWQSLGKYDPDRCKFSTWFYGIVKNHVFEQFRSVKRGYKLDSLDEDKLMESGDYWEVDSEATVERLLSVLPTDSPERHLADLVLAGATVRVAASRLGLSESAARKRLRRSVRFSYSMSISNE